MLNFLNSCLNCYIRLRNYLTSDGLFGMKKMGNVVAGTMIIMGLFGQLNNKIINTIMFYLFGFSFFLLIFISAVDIKHNYGRYEGQTTIEIIRNFSTSSYLFSMIDVIVVRLSFIIFGLMVFMSTLLESTNIQFTILTDFNIYLIIYIMFIFYTLLYFTYHITRNTADLEEIDLLLKLYNIIISCVSCIIILTNIINATFVVSSAITTSSVISYIIGKKKLDDKKLLKNIPK